jgi:hypothetical protein
MKKYSDAFKQRCVSGVRFRLKKHKVSKAIRLVADHEGIPAKSVEDWYYRAKKKQEKSEADIGRVPEKVGMVDRPASSSPAAPPPEPVAPYVNTDSGVPFCSRCKNKQIEEQEEGLWFCSVCNTSLPWPEQGDVEIKYRGGSGRHYGKYGWMA